MLKPDHGAQAEQFADELADGLLELRTERAV